MTTTGVGTSLVRGLVAAGLALSILKRVEGSVDVILVDHVERPTEN